VSRIAGLRRSAALRWGLVYLALMPVFATIYVSLSPGSFHDSNIEHEQATAADAAKLIGVLTHDIVQRWHHGDVSWNTSDGDFYLTPSTVRVDRLRRTPDGLLLLEVSGHYYGYDSKASGVFVEWIDVLIENRVAVGARRQPLRSGFVVSRSDERGAPVKTYLFEPPVSVLFPLAGAGSGSYDVGELLLPAGSYRQLVRFYAATGGDPAYASGHWMRMLYFSATALTTLGFGDITPVSTEARTWVTVQAVLGVVVIGLFLNALASRPFRRREPVWDAGVS